MSILAYLIAVGGVFIQIEHCWSSKERKCFWCAMQRFVCTSLVVLVASQLDINICRLAKCCLFLLVTCCETMLMVRMHKQIQSAVWWKELMSVSEIQVGKWDQLKAIYSKEEEERGRRTSRTNQKWSCLGCGALFSGAANEHDQYTTSFLGSCTATTAAILKFRTERRWFSYQRLTVEMVIVVVTDGKEKSAQFWRERPKEEGGGGED